MYKRQVVLVPNAELFTLRVTNNTATPTRRGTLTFPLGYDNDLPRVLEVLKRAIDETPGVLTKPPNTIIVREFTDADIILELRFWTESTRSDFLDAASHVAQSVVAALKREGIALPEADLRYLQWWDEYRQERGIGISKQ